MRQRRVRIVNDFSIGKYEGRPGLPLHFSAIKLEDVSVERQLSFLGGD
jgi:hypothetical protein